MSRARSHTSWYVAAITIGVLVGCAGTPGPQLPAWALAEGPTDSAATVVLDAAATAMGGRDRMKSVRTIEQITTAEAFGGKQRTSSVREVATGRFYRRIETSNGATEAGFDGENLWQKTPFFRGYVDPSDQAARAAVHAAAQARDSASGNARQAFRRLSDDTIDHHVYQVLGTVNEPPAGGRIALKYYYDPATHYLVRIEQLSGAHTTLSFDDYRTVDGRVTPFKTTQEAGGQTVVSHVERLRYNVTVPEDAYRYKDERGNVVAAPVRNRPVATEQPSAGPRITWTKPTDTIPQSVRDETFQYTWRRIRDTYFDTTFNGRNWDSVRLKYAPLAAAEKQSGPFHQLLGRMIGELGQSHMRVIPPGGIVTQATPQLPPQPGTVGVELGWANGQVLVETVQPGSSAALAGIRPGFAVLTVDGADLDSLYRRARAQNPGMTILREPIVRVRSVQSALLGRAKTAVTITYLGEDAAHPITRKLERIATVGGGMNAPEFEWRRLAPDVGYIRFSVFGGDVANKVKAALDSLRGTVAVVFDLRRNPGGVGEITRAIGSRLSKGPGTLGTSRFRHETQSFAYDGSGDSAYTGRVVVLVDAASGSSSEVLAGGLQSQHRAVVVGDTTAGAVLPSIISPLPSGGGLQHAVGEYRTPDGVLLEGRGVAPDVVVSKDRRRESLLAGHDPALERALEVARGT
jgi:carboxyl-terminal processing protease